MPYHYGHGKERKKRKKPKKPKMNKKKKIMVKVASITNIIKGLKPRQQKTMKASCKRFIIIKHMRSMARAMKKGATFQTAQKKMKCR